MTPPISSTDEARRLAALRQYAVLHTPPEEDFDDLARLAAHLCGAPMATITLIDERREWFKARVGMAAAERPLELSFCVHALRQTGLLIVPDATQDPRFARHPLVTGAPGIRFYAGAPLVTPEGAVLGTLCVLDHVPRTLAPAQAEALRVLSRQVMAQLELRRQTRVLRANAEESRALLERSLWLASFPESNPNPILEVEVGSGEIHYLNPGGERRFPDLRARGLGHPLLAGLAAAAAAAEREPAAAVGRESEAGGGHFALTITLVPETRRVRVYAADITAQKAHEREIERVSRLYAALSQVNQAIVWIPARDELFRKICEVLVEFGGFGMAWIGWHDAERRRLIPVAACGDETAYLQSIEIFTDERPEGRGPTGTAFREGRPSICNDMFNDPATQPWQGELERRGWRSGAAFPIRRQGTVCGTLTVCAGEAGFFRDKEVALVEEAAGDLSFALDNFAREEARQQAETIIQSEKLFSDTMIESMPGVIYFYDDQGRFLRWNRNFETVTGYSGEEIARMHPRDFFASTDQRPLQERIAEVFAQGDSSIEAPIVAKDGRATPYFFTGRRVIFDGRACLVGVGIDISKRQAAELALRELNETLEHKVSERTAELQRALVRAEAADRLKSAFLATMSHELRTPLNSIIGFTGIVLMGKAGALNAEQAKQLGMVRESAWHLLALINDVLDLSKIEAGQLEVHAEPFGLPASIERVMAMVGPQAEKKGLILAAVVAPELGEMVSDRRRVEQILLNLLSNAVKFTDYGRVTLAAELLVDFQPSLDAMPRPAVRLQVADTGIGLKPEDLTVLFEPFRQIDTGLARQAEGTGLGLAISRRLATLLGGEISAASKWSQGSEFTLILPLQNPPDPCTRPSS